MLNRGGKKIDLQHSQKQSVVGAHIITPQYNEPTFVEKGHMSGKEVVAKRMQSVVHQPTHI